MKPLEKSAQGLRDAYLYCATLPQHDSAAALKHDIEVQARAIISLSAIHIVLDASLGVCLVVVGLSRRARPNQRFEASLKRLSGEGKCIIMHCAKGDALAYEIGAFAALKQRVSTLKTTVDFEKGVQFVAPRVVHEVKHDFYSQLEHVLIPQLKLIASGRVGRRINRARQVY